MCSVKLLEICPDFPDWPGRWSFEDPDLPFGRQVLAEFEPFVETLIASGLAKKTLRRHLSNRFLLGGEVVRDLYLLDESPGAARELLLDSIDESGGPYSRHLDSAAEINSFNATCSKLYAFLRG